MYKRLGNFVAHHWVIVIVAWGVLLPTVGHFSPAWSSITNDGDMAYLPARMTTRRGEQLMAQAFPENQAKSQFAVVLERDSGLSRGDIDVAERIAERFAPEAEHGLPIINVVTPQTEIIGQKLVSSDHKAALVIINLSREFMAVSNIDALAQVELALDEARNAPDFPAGLQLGVTGSAAIGGDMLSAAQESIKNIELATVVLVVAILLIVYRAPLLVIVPLIAIVVSARLSMNLVALLTQLNGAAGWDWFHYKVFTTTRIFIIVILFGSGTDFCLFLISRYREELSRGLERRTAVATAVEHIGEAVVGSALTAIVGLGMMYFADFGKFSNSGPTIALCLAVTLLSCLTLAPAILMATGAWLFWPFASRAVAQPAAMNSADTPDRGLWALLGRAIIARPALILTVSVLALLPLAIAGYRDTKISYNLLSELPADRVSVVGTKMLRGHFAAGQTGPVTIVVYHPQGAFDTDAGEREIALLTKALYIDGVSTVRSLTEPLGDKPGAFRAAKIAALKNPRSKATYLTPVPELHGQVTRFDVVTRYDPFSRDAAAVVDALDEQLTALAHDSHSYWAGASFDFAGATAGTRDLRAVTESDQRLIQQLVLLGVYFVLVVMLRRPLLSIYLVLSVLFSYYVTLGATQLAFRYFYADYDGIDWKVPLFLFVILVAIGEDYNIYLITRVFEEQRHRGLLDGLRGAVVRTGGIITSCGVIMAGSFISMLTGTMRGIVELGFALSLGVMLDTIVVRPILVPAFLALCWRRADRKASPPAQRESGGKDAASQNGARTELRPAAGTTARSARAGLR